MYVSPQVCLLLTWFGQFTILSEKHQDGCFWGLGWVPCPPQLFPSPSHIGILGQHDPLGALGLHGREGSPTATRTWWEPMIWHVESTNRKPHTTCKADLVLILVSVVLLSFLFSWEWIFISRCDSGSVNGLWFPFAITAHGFGCLGTKVAGAAGLWMSGVAFPGNGEVGGLPWAQGSLTGQDPQWSHAPHLGFLSLSLRCLRSASKGCFGNRPTCGWSFCSVIYR